jgi:sugar/nucleoside kinase (ribokinase family)
VDLLAEVSDDYIGAHAGGEKGGMVLIGPQDIETHLGQIASPIQKVPGGAAANTTFALAKMRTPSTFLGKLGIDEDGEAYAKAFQAVGGDPSRFKRIADIYTARCLSLVTPDSQRTMRTDLGAAAQMAPGDITPEDFARVDHAHVEGYLAFNRDLLKAVLEAAKEAGCTVSFDMGSFEVVRASEDILPDLLKNYIDAVFANEDEGEAFTGSKDPEAALKALGECCDTAAVKLGPDGALLKRGGETCRVSAIPVHEVVDSTGAGDLWAAGFLYGYLRGLPLATCGELGALLGGQCVQFMGADLHEAAWEHVLKRLEEIEAAV